MPRKRGPSARTSRVDQRLARIEAALHKLSRSCATSRTTGHRALRQLERHSSDLETHARHLDVQFKRLAEIQADLDGIKRAWQTAKAD